LRGGEEEKGERRRGREERKKRREGSINRRYNSIRYNILYV
jgi:hypothetical protein